MYSQLHQSSVNPGGCQVMQWSCQFEMKNVLLQEQFHLLDIPGLQLCETTPQDRLWPENLLFWQSGFKEFLPTEQKQTNNWIRRYHHRNQNYCCNERAVWILHDRHDYKETHSKPGSCQNILHRESSQNSSYIYLWSPLQSYHCKKIFVILTIALSSELKPTDMDSYIAATILLLQY